MSDLSQLLEFGFDEKKAKRALRKTNNSGLQPALDYLQDHDGSDGADSDEEDANINVTSAGGADAEAKSLKCTDCGKVFRNTAEASWHGDKSGHSNFEESTEEKKPLTEEEKKEKLKELQEKAAARKAAAAAKDAEEARRNEAIRRKGGQDMGKIKEELKLKEAEKEAKQRKQDKIDEAKARARVKAQIEQDKRERAEKFAREKAIRDGHEPTTSVTSVGNVSNAASTATKPAASSSASDAPQTRLSIRLPYGQPIITTRESSEKLKDTVEWVRNNCNQQIFQGKVSIPFPRKQFSDAEMEKTLKELDLTPSSVILIN